MQESYLVQNCATNKKVAMLSKKNPANLWGKFASLDCWDSSKVSMLLLTPEQGGKDKLRNHSRSTVKSKGAIVKQGIVKLNNKLG